MGGRVMENILVVEDEEGFRQVIPQALNLMGYACHSVASTVQALDSLDRERTALSRNINDSRWS